MSLSANIVLRPFEPDDLEQCAAVERSVYGSATFRPIFFRQLYDLAPAMQWVAADGSKVVGHLWGATVQGGQLGWILNLAVLAHYRRQGIGERLLQTEIDTMREVGVPGVRITAEAENADVVRLYEKLGFRRIGFETNYYGDGLDRAIFEMIF
jgi:[ribosomal protein S18]-alanine N-acetyltransferase